MTKDIRILTHGALSVDVFAMPRPGLDNRFWMAEVKCFVFVTD